MGIAYLLQIKMAFPPSLERKGKRTNNYHAITTLPSAISTPFFTVWVNDYLEWLILLHSKYREACCRLIPILVY